MGDNLDLIQQHIDDEKRFIKKFQHENLVEIKDAQIIAEENCSSNSGVVIITEYVPGCTIADIINRFGPLEEKIIMMYLNQLVNAIRYLHSQNYHHGNLKNSNILIDSGGILKLTDYVHFKPFEIYVKDHLMQSKSNFNYYTPPEFFTNGEFSISTDIWQLGISLIEMANGKVGISEQISNSEQGYDETNIEDAYLKKIPKLNSNLSGSLKNFIYSCIKINPLHRPLIHHLIQLLDSMKSNFNFETKEVKSELIRMVTKVNNHKKLHGRTMTIKPSEFKKPTDSNVQRGITISGMIHHTQLPTPTFQQQIKELGDKIKKGNETPTFNLLREGHKSNQDSTNVNTDNPSFSFCQKNDEITNSWKKVNIFPIKEEPQNENKSEIE